MPKLGRGKIIHAARKKVQNSPVHDKILTASNSFNVQKKVKEKKRAILSECTISNDFEYSNEGKLASYLCRAIYTKGDKEIRQKYNDIGCKVVYTNLTEEVDHFTTNYAVLTHDESKTIVTVFRGSQNAKDWLTNFRAIPAKLFEGISIHKGFLNALEKQWKKNILPVYIELLQSGRYENIIMCGHSLGGALASGLYLRWMKSEESINLRKSTLLFTFGAPLSLFYKKPVEELLNDLQFIEPSMVHNFVNNHDLVPRLLGGTTLGPNRGYYIPVVKTLRQAIVQTNRYWIPFGCYYFMDGRATLVTNIDDPTVSLTESQCITIPDFTEDDLSIADGDEFECSSSEDFEEDDENEEITPDCTIYLIKPERIMELLKLPYSRKAAKKCVQDHSMKFYKANMYHVYQ